MKPFFDFGEVLKKDNQRKKTNYSVHYHFFLC